MKTHIDKFQWDYLATRTLKLNDDKLSIDYSNMIRSGHWDIKYSDYKTDFMIGKAGNTGWGSIALLLFIIGVGFSFFDKVSNNIVIKGVFVFLPVILLIFAGMLFLLRFKKYDYVYFTEKENGATISIRITEKTKEFIEELKSKIIKANLTKV